MELILSFLGGAAVAALISWLIARSIVKARIEETKRDMRERNEEAMSMLQSNFNETIAKVSAQVKSETGEMLKARQEEFSISSSRSLGQIVDPLKENIAELE